MAFGTQTPNLLGIVHATLMQSSPPKKKKRRKNQDLFYLGRLGQINWLCNNYDAQWNCQPGNKQNAHFTRHRSLEQKNLGSVQIEIFIEGPCFNLGGEGVEVRLVGKQGSSTFTLAS